MWSLNDVSEFELREGFGFFFFCLVNLFTWEQIFAVVKRRHSSLILKEVLLETELVPVLQVQPCWDFNNSFESLMRTGVQDLH